MSNSVSLSTFASTPTCTLEMSSDIQDIVIPHQMQFGMFTVIIFIIITTTTTTTSSIIQFKCQFDGDLMNMYLHYLWQRSHSRRCNLSIKRLNIKNNCTRAEEEQEQCKPWLSKKERKKQRRERKKNIFNRNKYDVCRHTC